MKKYIYLLLSLLTISMSACVNQGGEEVKERISKYYDLLGVLKAQPALLEGRQLNKKGSFKDLEEQTSIRPDSAAWAKELSLFEKYDINKPSMLDAFEITDAVEGDMSVVRYDRKDSEPGVQEMILYYNGGDQPDSIAIKNVDENQFLSSVSEVKLYFAQVENQAILTGYEIKSLQKLVLADAVKIGISARVEE